MTSQTVDRRENVAKPSTDPFAEAKEKLFLPLRNRALAEAAQALAENQVAVAELLVAKHLKKKPTDPDALNLMADIARRSKRFEDAERLLSRCLDQRPDCAGYRYNYAVILRLVHKHDHALAQLDLLLGDDPRNPLYRDQKATALSWTGRSAEALDCRRRLMEDYPESPETWLRYGHALRDAGFQDQCIAAIHRALELAPSLTAAYASLADLKVYSFTPAETKDMEAQLESSGLAADVRADLHHALGNAYRDEKRYGKSFENYAKANALRRIGIDFDTGKLTGQRLACETFFTEAFFRDTEGWGCRSNAPIFIVGMFRSGSSLLEQILASHSAIEGLGELADLDSVLVRPFADLRDEIQLDRFSNGNSVDKPALAHAYVQLVDRLGADQFDSLGVQYLDITGLRRTTKRPFFTDKTLRNFFYIGLIRLILPNAKIIDMRRHPLDCGWSCFRSQFPGAYFARKLSDIGHDYSNYVRLMAHFDRVLPGRIHRVIYENLIADPNTELERLFHYLELPFEENCLRFHETRRTVGTQSSSQVRRPLYQSGVGQWRPYEPWLGPLKSALGAVLDHYPALPNDATREAATATCKSG